MRVFIYACEQKYGGLHGIEDFCVEEFDSREFADEDELDKYIWDEWISEMSWSLVESYGTIDYPEDEDDDEIDSCDIVNGYWCYIKDDVELSIDELNKEARRLGPRSFREEYCVKKC